LAISNQTVLIVDDEENILELLKFNLCNSGFKVVTALSGEKALDLCQKESVDLVLLDLMLPDIDGLEICRRLKSQAKTNLIPVIMLTAKTEEVDKLMGFELGADDYITKPFQIRELVARVKAHLRRSSLYGKTENEQKEQSVTKAGDLLIDSATYEVLRDKTKIDLTRKEFEMLKMLIKSSGKVLTREYLLDSIWGYEYYGESRTVDVHIRHLRQKLSENTSNEYIETVRGIGYKFNFKEAQ